MANEKLLEHIEKARAELVAVDGLSPEDRDLVGHLLTDIVAHLSEGQGDKDTQEHLSDRLNKQVANLEVNHPKLAGVLERMINALASLGI